MTRSPDRVRLLATLLSVGLLVAACRERPAPVRTDASASGPETLFEEMTQEVGLDFRHDSGVDSSYFLPEHVGSGGALFDYDGDGDLDLYLVNSGPHAGSQGSPASANRLFRQDGGGRLVDRTGESRTGDRGYGMGAAVGDYDGDGDLDLFVTNLGRDRLLRNEGDGRFTDRSDEAGFSEEAWSTSACFLDYDRDRDLDLFVVTYLEHDPPKRCTDRAGRLEYCGPLAYPGQPDLLYRNDGGRFTDASRQAGIAGRLNRGLGVACLDLNGDHLIDIYVANDGEANELWINDAGGGFEDRSLLMGAALNAMGKPEASMGVALGDVDGDLRPDLLLAHLDRETNTLYLNRGEGGFDDATASSGLGPDSLPYTGFGAGFFDYDLDGGLDLLVVNGRVTRREIPLPNANGNGPSSETGGPDSYWRDYAEPNLLFRREGSGYRNVSDRAGRLCSLREVSRGLAFGDLDLDGDPDVLTTQCNGPARLFRNVAPRSGSWLAVAAAPGTASGMLAAARLYVSAAGATRLALAASAYSYLTAGQPRALVGLGPASRIDQLELRWPDGTRTGLRDLPADRAVLVVPGTGYIERVSARPGAGSSS